MSFEENRSLAHLRPAFEKVGSIEGEGGEGVNGI